MRLLLNCLIFLCLFGVFCDDLFKIEDDTQKHDEVSQYYEDLNQYKYEKENEGLLQNYTVIRAIKNITDARKCKQSKQREKRMLRKTDYEKPSHRNRDKIHKSYDDEESESTSGLEKVENWLSKQTRMKEKELAEMKGLLGEVQAHANNDGSTHSVYDETETDNIAEKDPNDDGEFNNDQTNKEHEGQYNDEETKKHALISSKDRAINRMKEIINQCESSEDCDETIVENNTEEPPLPTMSESDYKEQTEYNNIINAKNYEENVNEWRSEMEAVVTTIQDYQKRHFKTRLTFEN